jgi:hypothetical protein
MHDIVFNVSVNIFNNKRVIIIIGENIWDDKGSHEGADCGVWAIKGGYNVNTFIAADNYNAPNPDLIWVLKEEVVEML